MLARIRMKVIGSAAAIAAACKARRPPVSSKVAATTPSAIAQNSRVPTGGLGLPPDAMMSMTMDAESDDVTKNRTMQSVAIPIATVAVQGFGNSSLSIANITVGNVAISVR